MPGKAHLREALLLHEEAQRINRMCRELRKKDQLAEVLRMSRENSLNKYADIDDEDDFQVFFINDNEYYLTRLLWCFALPFLMTNILLAVALYNFTIFLSSQEK